MAVAEAGVEQALLVHFERVRAHDVFNCRAFLRDLQLAVAIGALEAIVQCFKAALGLAIGKGQLF